MNQNDNIPDISADVPKKKFPWKAVNIVIAVLGVYNGCLISLILLSTAGLTFPVICIEILLNIFLVIFYKKSLKKKKYRKTVIALRISAIAMIILAFSIPYFAVHSDLEYDKSMYQVKKFIYCHGVYSRGMVEYLPARLPKVCEDYKFVTQVGSIAQDSHPSSYLIFHADTETMHELEEDYKQIDGAKLVKIEDAPDIEEYKQEYGDDYLDFIPEYPRQIPAHVYSMLDDEHIDDFFDAVIYEVPSYYSKGCIFDYDSGLVVYWT